MPPDTESLTISYSYERHRKSPVKKGFTSRQEINIIDLGLIGPDGTQVGASGSDKTEIEVSETYATPGYRACRLVPGEWHIIVGAYKVVADGIMVRYDVTFTSKHRRLLKGDLHTHTVASDGVLVAEELAGHALRHGLDFLAITDHNQMVSSDSLPRLPGLTLIPGIEWTHYQGHATFLGVDHPYDGSFMANTQEEVRARFNSARERGAVIAISHPFDEGCPFLFDMNSIPFDLLEIWNGPMRMSNIQAIGLWTSLLKSGKKIPISGGSDYHRSQLFLYPGGPTTCVYAMSTGQSDILSALREGHAYLTFAPEGPTLEMTAGDFILGDSVPFPEINKFDVKVNGLLSGDVLQVTTGTGSTTLLKAEKAGEFEGTYTMDHPGFARIEILRGFVPGLPELPALISNPIYFDMVEEGGRSRE